MSEQSEWGPWVAHDQSGCPPFAIGEFIEVEFHAGLNGRGVYRRSGAVTVEIKAAPDWRIKHPYDPVAPMITRYRVRKSPGFKMIEAALRVDPIDVPQREEVEA